MYAYVSGSPNIFIIVLHDFAADFPVVLTDRYIIICTGPFRLKNLNSGTVNLAVPERVNENVSADISKRKTSKTTRT